MANVFVKTRDGTEHTLAIQDGVTLMETINGAGLDELLALCGGSCSCATCHVHVDPGSMDMLPPMEVIEESMLEYAEHKNEFSRLSCQIPLSEALDGLRVQIAEED